MPGEAEMIFGKLAIQKGFLTEADLADAIRVQQDFSDFSVTKNLGGILIELGKLTPDQVKTILEAQKNAQSREEDRTYGELAVLNGFCSVDDIRVALAIQQRAVARKAPVVPPLGFILRERGKIGEQQHQALKQAQARLGKPVDLLQSTAPARIAELKAAATAPTCSICGEKAGEGATECALCGSTIATDTGKAADVATDQVIRTQSDKRGSPQPDAPAPAGQPHHTTAIPEAVPQAVPETVPQAAPRAIPRAAPQAVPQAVPKAAPQAAPRVVPEAPDQDALPPAPVGERLRAFVSGRILGYAAKAAGLLLMVVVGYYIFKGISNRSSLSEKEAEENDFSEECRDADRALKEAERIEHTQADTSDFRQILDAYDDIASDYPKTAAAGKASERKRKLECAFLIADEDFRKAKIAARDASGSGDHARAVAILDEFIARLSTMDLKPMLKEANTHLQVALADAQKDFLARLDEVLRALTKGKEDAAVERFEKLRDWKLFARCEECGRAFAEMDTRLAPIRTKLEEQRAAAAAEAQRMEEWRAGGPPALADGKRLAGEWKYAEAMLEFRKAMLFSGDGPVWTEAEEGLAAAKALLNKTRIDLQSALKFIRNWTVSKMYDRAANKCKEVAGNAAFSAFREDFLDAEKGLTELDKSKGDHEPLVKELDALLKTIDEWAANQLVVDPSLQCPECRGAGAHPCKACGGKGAIKGPDCEKCRSSGKVKCTQCEGAGTKPCPDCDGTGEVERWEEKTLKCEACGGKGKIWGGNKCTECDGKGTMKKKVKKDPAPCKTCAGQKRIPCKSCEKGTVACADCKGRGSNDTPCTDCSGKGSKACPKCSGSGLAPEKF